MKISVTKQMAGRKTETIDAHCRSVEDAFKKISAWKKQHKSDSKYHIAHYDRVMFLERDRKLVIDFGDYVHFIQVSCTKPEWEDVLKWHSKPASLDV